jgi:hypothetical protein
MPQTESLLLIVLGFSLASLIALFTLRMVWAAAVRAGVRRMQRQVPSSLAGLEAERTRLRAENTALAQRLAAQRESSKLQVAEQMAEVSRHRNRILAMEAEIARLERELADIKAASGAQPSPSRRPRRGARAAATQPAAPQAGAQQSPLPDERELRLRQRLDQLAALARQTEPSTPAAGDEVPKS